MVSSIHPSPPTLADVFALGEEFRNRSYGNNLMKNERRFHRTLLALWPHLSPGARILDLGGFPGTMVELLRHFASALDLSLEVGGLLFEEPFTARMLDLGVALRKINLDPHYDGLPTGTREPAYRLGDSAGVFDVVIATAWLRHRVDLLLGRTPNTPLEEGLLSGRTDTWRPHVRVFTMTELVKLVSHEGFRVIYKEFLDMTRRGQERLLHRLAYLVPSLRHGLLVVARREAEAKRWPGERPP
jgi:hypothetical protein